MLSCLRCHLPRYAQEVDGAGALMECASFSSLREGAPGAAEPALEAPPDLPLEQLLDPTAAEWGAALAAAARGAAGSSAYPSAAGEPGGAPPAGTLESGMLDMSAFGMGEAHDEPSSGGQAGALESGMLDMSAFGMGAGEAQAQPAPGGGLDSGQLDASAFGMGAWDSGGGDGGGGDAQQSQAGAQESGILDMGAFGMGGWDSEQQGAGPAPGGQGSQPSGAPGQALVLKMRPPERFAALPDGELEELRGLLGVPGGPARRRGRWDDAGDENGDEPRCRHWLCHTPAKCSSCTINPGSVHVYLGEVSHVQEAWWRVNVWLWHASQVQSFS